MTLDNETNKSMPPLSFQLDEVNITFTRHAGSKSGSSVNRASINGKGSSILEKEHQDLPYTYATQDVIALINTLYKIRFFDYPTRHNVEYSVFLKEDGTINTSALKMNDQASTTVCFRTTSYEKCVTYNANNPKALDQLTQQVFSDAERLATDGKQF